MNRKNNRRKALWITVFVVLVSLTGFALAASGNFENPLAAFVGGGGREGGGQRGAPPQQSSDQTSTRPARGAGGEGGDQSSFSIAQIGSVLYNVWFLFAITAVVIVVQTVGGDLIQRLRQRVPRNASP